MSHKLCYGLFVLFLATTLPMTQSTAQTRISVPITMSSAPQAGDAGTVTITAAGYTRTITYNQYSTTNSIASALGAKFSQDSCSPVWAKASGSLLILTSRTATTKITLSASTSSNLFSQSSFLVNTSAETTCSVSGGGGGCGGDPCCGDPCCGDPCCGDPCCGDPCCGGSC